MQKNERRTISENEERLRALITATSDVIYGLSADWEVMHELDGRGFLKDTSEPITGWRNQNIYPDDMEMVNAAIGEAIREKKIFQLEHRVLRADGSPGWTFSRAVPILDNKGDIVEWFGVASDITERKEMEHALLKAKEQSEQQKRLYETITSGTPDLMYVFGLDYRFIYANSALLTMWGKTWENAVGKSLLENGYEPWHAEMHEREIDQVIASKQPIRGEVSFPHSILGKRVYDYIFTPVFNDQGNVEAVAGTTRDVTERKQQEQQLQQVKQSIIEPFRASLGDEDRYEELEEDIAFFLNSDKIPSTLSAQKRLAAAYDMAERINPVGRMQQNTARLNTAPPERPINPAGAKSIKGAPNGTSVPKGANLNSRDAIEAAMRQIGL